jgi:uncharacterized protein YodC (DUF2158 family)
MTVRDYRAYADDELLVEVDWFSGTKAQHARFRVTSLVPAEDDGDSELKARQARADIGTERGSV